MIPLEVIDALLDAGCTGDQILAAIRADQHRLMVRRMLRRARAALGDAAPESAFPLKPDSGVRISAGGWRAPERNAGGRGPPSRSISRDSLLPLREKVDRAKRETDEG